MRFRRKRKVLRVAPLVPQKRLWERKVHFYMPSIEAKMPFPQAEAEGPELLNHGSVPGGCRRG